MKGQIESQGTYKQILSTSSSTIKQLSRSQTEELNAPDNSPAESLDLNEESKKLSEDMHLKEQVLNKLFLILFFKPVLFDSILWQKLSRKEREETQQNGSVSWRLYFDYFFAGGGFLGTFLVMLLFLAAQSMIVACDYWLFLW